MKDHQLFLIITLFICSLCINHIILRAQLDQSNSGFLTPTFLGSLEKNIESKCFIDAEYDQNCQGIMDCSYKIGLLTKLHFGNDTQPYLSYAFEPNLTNSTLVALFREFTNFTWLCVDIILIIILLFCVLFAYLLQKKDREIIALMCLMWVTSVGVLILTFVAHDDRPFGVWQNVISGFFVLIFYTFFAISVIQSNLERLNNRSYDALLLHDPNG